MGPMPERPCAEQCQTMMGQFPSSSGENPLFALQCSTTNPKPNVKQNTFNINAQSDHSGHMPIVLKVKKSCNTNTGDYPTNNTACRVPETKTCFDVRLFFEELRPGLSRIANFPSTSNMSTK